MFIATIAGIVLLGLLDRAIRLGRIELLIIRTRHKIFALRDLLRDSAIWGEVDPNTFEFDLLDGALTHGASMLRPLTLLDLIGFGLAQTLFHPEIDPVYMKFRERLKNTKDGRLRAIADSYGRCMYEFLEQRNRVGYATLSRLSHVVSKDNDHRQIMKPDIKQRAFEALQQQS